MQPFHLAIPVDNLEVAKDFYVNMFNCKIGRTCENWIDFDFYGHQLSIHLKPEETSQASKNIVDGKYVPVRHYGVILKWEQWHKLSETLKQNKINFIIEPYIRFKGEIGEQATMFFTDPSGNALEFKSFKDESRIFAS